MRDYSKWPKSKNLEDRTHRPMSQMEQDIRFRYELSPDEEFLMKENGWTHQDIYILRQLHDRLQWGHNYAPLGPEKSFGKR